MPARADLDRRLDRVDELIQQLETGVDPSVRATTQELVATLMELHAAGLERIVALIRHGPEAGALLGRVAGDELASALLLLHGLHPVNLETRVSQALEKARPYLKSHGGNVDLVGIDADGTVRLRMEGSCHGCPSSSVTLTLAIEKAIREAAPDAGGILVEQDQAHRDAGPLPLVELSRVPVPLAAETTGPA